MSQQQQTNPFGVDKAYDWKDTGHNPRRHNVAVGAATGTVMYGGLGGGFGAAHGAHQARRGLSLLHSVGAKPSAVRSAGIVAGHAARGGGRAAAVLAPVGALAGLAGGALSPAKRKRRRATVGKSAFGVELGKAEKSLTGKPGDLRNTQYFAGSTLGANLGRLAGGRATGSGLSALRSGGGKAAAAGHAAGAVLGLGAVRLARKKTRIAKSAFGVELPDRG